MEDAATAKACAFHAGLLLAGQVGCNRLAVESDYMEVIETMQNGGNSLGAAAVIHEESVATRPNNMDLVYEYGASPGSTR